MFRRSRQSERAGSTQEATTPSPPPVFDVWCGDYQSPQLQAALLEGNWEPLRDALAEAAPPRRDFIVRRVTDQARPTPALDEWIKAEPKSNLPLVVRGAQRINGAWVARGRRYAPDSDSNAWQGFQQGVLDAEVDLRQAIRVDDTDPLPWIHLLISGRTLHMTADQACEYYEHIEELHPGLPSASDQLLQCLSEKWLGSHETMLAFARDVTANTPPGHPRHRVVATAHLERAIAYRDDRVQRDEYRHNPDVHAELIAAADKSVFHQRFADGPEERVTLSWFATAMGYFDLVRYSRPLLERIQAAPAPSGFDYFGNPIGVYQRFREATGLPRETPPSIRPG